MPTDGFLQLIGSDEEFVRIEGVFELLERDGVMTESVIAQKSVSEDVLHE